MTELKELTRAYLEVYAIEEEKNSYGFITICGGVMSFMTALYTIENINAISIWEIVVIIIGALMAVGFGKVCYELNQEEDRIIYETLYSEEA